METAGPEIGAIVYFCVCKRGKMYLHVFKHTHTHTQTTHSVSGLDNLMMQNDQCMIVIIALIFTIICKLTVTCREFGCKRPVFTPCCDITPTSDA